MISGSYGTTDAVPVRHRRLTRNRTAGVSSRFLTQDAWRPWTEMTHVVSPSYGPRASGVLRGLPVRRPMVSIRPHHGATPASSRFGGLMIRHTSIIAERF